MAPKISFDAGLTRKREAIAVSVIDAKPPQRIRCGVFVDFGPVRAFDGVTFIDVVDGYEVGMAAKSNCPAS